jgi:2-oxoglutarate dehydrogenase complex dihydrolipoamide succinyltransferase (E2) component
MDPSVAHSDGSGDVKYHLGHSDDYRTRTGRKVHLSLCFNPSHLEFVNVVAMGRIRAKQDRVGDTERRRGMVLLIHGDAAFAAEGIIQETLNLSRLDACKVGGTLHVIINNQIGFTTAPREGRSTTYATDIVKMLQIPIFHVNGDDPEAVAHVVRLALDFRRQFKQDAVIDLYCYRRLGHNEGDEPTFTQPRLYQAIKKQKPAHELYLERLIEVNSFTRETLEKKPAIEEETQEETQAEEMRKPLRLHQVERGAKTGAAEVTAGRETKEPSAPGELRESSRDREEEAMPVTQLRRRIAERLVQAQQSAALLTTFNEIDMSAVIELREKYREAFSKKYQIKLGFMSFFVKAAIEALKLIPDVNAEIRDRSIVYHRYFDIGAAVGGGKGLVVPVLRNAERLSFAEIEKAIHDFARRAEQNKLKPGELQGGTFTISNGGIYGSLLSTPIINPPQSGILGLHAIQDRPVARQGAVVVRPMMYVALTYDHRIVDGREAVTFLGHIKNLAEDPARILLEI